MYYTNEYTLLIAIILTAKTKEYLVNKITNNLFNIIKSPKDAINLSKKKIKLHIKYIGLYNKKSKYIYELSKILIKKYNSIIPKNISELKKLPGVGQKTSSVFLSYMSEIFDVFPVDTHIKRLMNRWNLVNSKKLIDIEKKAKLVFEKKNWKKLHLQIILYGREYSPYRKWNLKKDIIYQKLLYNNLL
ncbi:endonuclease III domain-containing protein [Blattabacterium cuenoti]|uniref:endonuclease III domain-containing protein n=1 Tax=Blattabacterium cuenoti TaxID=1653831 RepID=UPI001EEC0905|nr:endonuclease III [Blattabacterium cuenoti]